MSFTSHFFVSRMASDLKADVIAARSERSDFSMCVVTVFKYLRSIGNRGGGTSSYGIRRNIICAVESLKSLRAIKLPRRGFLNTQPHEARIDTSNALQTQSDHTLCFLTGPGSNMLGFCVRQWWPSLPDSCPHDTTVDIQSLQCSIEHNTLSSTLAVLLCGLRCS